MSKLSPQPYKGTRDYYPQDKRVQNYIFDTWRRVVERFGYQEYGAPLLEPLEVYTAKSGQELANEQTYSFVDRGDRTVAIRPEMTPTVSRMVAARRQELGYPARLYSIANFMRYERPQRGREREFWQLNADLFGAEGSLADAEIIELAHSLMLEFGATDDMYIIRINSRELISHMMSEYLQLDEANSKQMVKLFDRKDKISYDDFVYQVTEILGQVNAEKGLEKIVDLTKATQVSDLPEELRQLDAVSDLEALFAHLNAAGVKNIRFDVTLMRGLDYYTGMVFEVFDVHPDNNRAMFGGGRYDGLVGLFGAEALPTVGFAPGLTTTELFLRTHGLLPNLTASTAIAIVVIDDSIESALDCARVLRSKGVNVEVDITNRKLDKQIKSVIKRGVPYILFIGAEESKSKLFTFKELFTQKEEKLSLDQIVTKIQNN